MERIKAGLLPFQNFLIRGLISILLLFTMTPPSYSQPIDTVTTINPTRLKTVIIGSTVAYTGIMIGLSSVWYSQYDKQEFQFFNDADEWNQVDKAGHFYSAFQLSSIGSRTLQWSGVSKKKSDLAGTITSFAVMSSIEVLDGFSAGYGASASDLLANALGAGFYLGQQALWHETKIYPKFSFHRTEYAEQRPEALGSTLMEQIIKDYNGQTYWLSADVDKFVKFPRWLNLAVGYGAEDMLYANEEDNLSNGLTPYRQFYLGIDFDLTAIKSKSKFVNSLIYVVNMIKLPAPTLEFSQGKVKGHFFYF
ncbi:MAG TPA: DUF2279 domain-containing protein [Cyclobacteriaceae bacterium]|nr:DUF2279 domain-containing protein [Cyclobacteriaceae bacterium]